MKTLVRICLVLVLAGAVSATQAAVSLPRTPPEAQGVSSAAMIEFVNSLDQQIEGMHSVMVVRHGQVIAEGWWSPYDAEHNHVLYSLSKSFPPTAVGLAVAEGKMSIDDEVLKFFPDDAPADPGNNLKQMRVRDLLTMSTGHQDEPPVAPDVVSAKSFLAQAVPHLPGTHFKYNTAATFMQSAIVQKVRSDIRTSRLSRRMLSLRNRFWPRPCRICPAPTSSTTPPPRSCSRRSSRRSRARRCSIFSGRACSRRWASSIRSGIRTFRALPWAVTACACARRTSRSSVSFTCKRAVGMATSCSRPNGWRWR